MPDPTRGDQLFERPDWLAEASSARTYHYLGIGINTYQHIPQLYNPVPDVQAFANTLEAYGFQQDQTTLLLDEQASRSQILKTLRSFARKLTPQDNLVLYFAGHGIIDDITGEGYWIPVEGKADDYSTYVSNDEVVDLLKYFKAHHVLLIIDSCFSGTFFQQTRSLGSKYDRSPSRFAISSGSSESVPDGAPAEHSPFAKRALAYLTQHEEPYALVSELANYIKRGNFHQQPQAHALMIDGHEEGEFVFFRKGSFSPQPKTPTSTIDYEQSVIKELGLDFVYVEGGTYKRGSKEAENEQPIHKVTLDDFEISKYPVTQAQWIHIMGKNPSFDKGDPQYPVEYISWNEVQVFLQKLSEQTGHTFRLPTEGEWEFAARGGNLSEGFLFAGANELDEIAWYRLNSGQHSHKVGQKEPNELELYDMSGLVWEFCSDIYGPYPREPITNPGGTSRGVSKVIRGGCLNDYEEMCRLTARRKFGPQFRDYFLGFRLAYTPKAET